MSQESKSLTKKRIHMFCAWSFFTYAMLLMAGWWVFAGYMPPIPPTATPNEVLALYESNLTGIRIGMVICMIAAPFYMPQTGILCYYLSRIEGYIGPLTWTQALAGIASVMLTYLPPMFWLITAYRMDRDPSQIQMLNDIAWIQIVGGLTIYLPSLITIFVASQIDKSKFRVFPRWFGYMCIWVMLGQLPGQLIFFFKEGPFAWNGLFAFYVPMTVFFAWFMVATYLMRRATLHDFTEDRDWCPANSTT